MFLLLRHGRERVPVLIGMLYELCRKFVGIHRIRPGLVECRMPLVDMEPVLDDRTHSGTLRNIGEPHILSIPVENHIEPLEPYGEHTHHDHFVDLPR